MKNVAFHSLLMQMTDDYTTNSHHITFAFLFGKVGEAVFFELWGESVNLLGKYRDCRGTTSVSLLRTTLSARKNNSIETLKTHHANSRRSEKNWVTLCLRGHRLF